MFIPLLLTILVFTMAASAIYGWLTRPRRIVLRPVNREAKRADPARVPSVWFRLSYPFVAPFVPLVARFVRPRFRARATTALQRAGMADGISPEHLLAFKIFLAIVLTLLVALLSGLNPVIVLAAAAGAFYLPDWLLVSVRRWREHQVLRALPGAVDVLSLSVEAGLEFLIAIQRFVERGTAGPLRDELATILSDIRLGQSRAEALKSFAGRVDIPEVSSFVSVLVQADMLGASIGTVLKSQAERMRAERFQRAEKAGAKATQKILFPMVLCIFPAVLIVIIGPVVLILIAARS
jgi:tight adherence protein C